MYRQILPKREKRRALSRKEHPILHTWSINQVTDQCARAAPDCNSSTGRNFFPPLRKIVTAPPPPGTRSFIVPSIVSSLPRCSMNEKELARLAQQREGCKPPQKERSPLCLSAYSCSQLHDQFDMLILLSSPPFVPGCNVVFIPWSRIPQRPRKRLLLPAPHARVSLHPSGGVGRESRPREGKGDADDGRRRDRSITNFVDRLIRPREKLRQFPILLHPTPIHET